MQRSARSFVRCGGEGQPQVEENSEGLKDMARITERSITTRPLVDIMFISHGTLDSVNLQASRRFYEEVFGFEFGTHSGATGSRTAAARRQRHDPPDPLSIPPAAPIASVTNPAYHGPLIP